MDNRRLLSVYLREAGATVSLAENGLIGSTQALAAAAEGQPFGVILMDMQMPELDGYGATARLRAKGYAGPIIALTAHAMAEDREKCISAGCTDYLSKPVRRDHLIEMVARYLHPAPMPAVPTQNMPPGLRSTSTEKEILAYLNEYIGQLPAMVEELRTSIERGTLQDLAQKSHNLRGTGGLYGLMPITDAAGRVEDLITAGAPVEAIRDEVSRLIDVIRSVEGFKEFSPPTARAAV
jgi:CheY-like chemotaxis protein